MNFSLSMPGRIVFGRGEASNLPRYVSAFARSFLIVTAPPLVAGGAVPALLESFAEAGLCSEVYAGVTGEPTPATVQEAAEVAVERGCGALIGMGGGSAMDTAKAAAGVAANGGPVLDYLEGVGAGRRMLNAPLPFIAAPTTSGTGAEATKNAVLSDAAAGYKASFRDERLLARLAVIDPELTLGVPPDVTARSGMDALTQLIESYISKKAQPVTDALALSGMRSAAASLERAYRDGSDIEARENMAYASFLSGVCLANSGLGADHGIAAALGAVEGVPHGLACAVLLPGVLRLNIPHVGPKAAPLCEALTGRAYSDAASNAAAVVDFVCGLASRIGIPEKLGLKGMDGRRMKKLLGAVSRSSMSGNPVEVGEAETIGLIRQVL